MKIQAFFLMTLFALSTSFSLVDSSDNAFSRAYHNRNNISLVNFDGTRSKIYVNANSATLSNSDGTTSTIEFLGNSSNLVAIDGTHSTVFFNGLTSTVMDADGSQFVVNHRTNRSSCTTEYGTHMVTHNFGNHNERRYKKIVDVLIHKNWLKRKKIVQKPSESDQE